MLEEKSVLAKLTYFNSDKKRQISETVLAEAQKDNNFSLVMKLSSLLLKPVFCEKDLQDLIDLIPATSKAKAELEEHMNFHSTARIGPIFIPNKGAGTKNQNTKYVSGRSKA